MWDLTKILKFGWYFEANCVIWSLYIFLSPKLNSCRFSGWILDVMTENCKKMGKSSKIVHRRVSSDFENLESLIFTGPVLYRFSIDHSEVEKVLVFLQISSRDGWQIGNFAADASFPAWLFHQCKSIRVLAELHLLWGKARFSVCDKKELKCSQKESNNKLWWSTQNKAKIYYLGGGQKICREILTELYETPMTF